MYSASSTQASSGIPVDLILGEREGEKRERGKREREREEREMKLSLATQPRIIMLIQYYCPKSMNQA